MRTPQTHHRDRRQSWNLVLAFVSLIPPVCLEDLEPFSFGAQNMFILALLLSQDNYGEIKTECLLHHTWLQLSGCQQSERAQWSALTCTGTVWCGCSLSHRCAGVKNMFSLNRSLLDRSVNYTRVRHHININIDFICLDSNKYKRIKRDVMKGAACCASAARGMHT